MHEKVDNQNKIGKTPIENKALIGYLDPQELYVNIKSYECKCCRKYFCLGSFFCPEKIRVHVLAREGFLNSCGFIFFSKLCHTPRILIHFFPLIKIN